MLNRSSLIDLDDNYLSSSIFKYYSIFVNIYKTYIRYPKNDNDIYIIIIV